jgi:DNA helicase II / ATP-dependent DNA helicase PcrA
MQGRRIDYEKELNEEQLAAVQAPDGPVLVIAAAGTGKTRTLVYRVAWLVEQGIDPRGILLLTFTNRAANEMLDRARALVGDSVSGMWGGTFHHMANRILRRHGTSLGYRSDFTILDQDDARSLVKSCINELKLTDKHVPKPDVLLSLFGFASGTEKSLERLASDRFEFTPIAPEDIVRVHKLYQKRKVDLGAMDFDDLLANGLRLFREFPDCLAHYRERFVHTLVDEYQDTNTIQATWVDMVAGPKGNLLVVGDDFQSIYSWRGANFKNILSFPERYPGAAMYKLVTNYRSVPEILNLANACIAGNPEQFQKTLKAVREPHQRPWLVELRDGQEQARFIIEKIRNLRAEGYRMSEITVLYRSHFQALELQMELSSQRMPFVITSGMRFFEQAHIKDACAVLRLFSNPGDELAFLRLLGLWPRVGPKTGLKIWASLGRRCDLRKQATREKLKAALPKVAQDAWSTVEQIGEVYDRDELHSDPGEVVHRFVAGFYRVHAMETFENADRRLEDLEELVNFSTRFATVDEMLSEVALQSNLDTEGEAVDAGDTERIRLSTVHQAKGLEWSVVFILWLADGLFPSSRSLNEDESDAEERRLFYVATTRAKDELYLCTPRMRRTREGGITFLSPSRFISEIPGAMMKRITPLS